MSRTKVAPPRRLTPDYKKGEIVQVGSTRWLVQGVLEDGRVELEASNVSPGIWWYTTLDKLPTRDAS